MSRQQHQRKQVYVSRAIQGRVVSKLAIYWATYHLALWHAMFLFHYFLYRGQLMANPEMSPIPFPVQYFQFLTQNYSMLVCALAVFPLIFWDMMKVTHRVAGPLVRFTHTLKQLEKGEKVRRVQLREGDLLDEFRDSFNSYLEKAGLLQDGEAMGEWVTDREAANSDVDTASEAHVLDNLHELSDAMDDAHAVGNDSGDESELETTAVGS